MPLLPLNRYHPPVATVANTGPAFVAAHHIVTGHASVVHIVTGHASVVVTIVVIVTILVATVANTGHAFVAVCHHNCHC